MVAQIILNASNIDSTDNNSLTYKFPNSVSFDNHDIAIQSVTMYYSWGNVNSVPLNNGAFSYTWLTPTGPVTYQVLIPNGQYEITTINEYLQFVMIRNGTYLINAAGFNTYFAELTVNASIYSVQVNTYPVPTSADWTQNLITGQWTGNVGTAYAGWTTPLINTVAEQGSWVGFSSSVFNPSLTFPANFNLLIGFPANYSTGLNQGASQNTNQSFTSSQFGLAPQVQPNSSIFLSITNIANKYSVPSSIIYAINPSVSFGSQIIDIPPQFAFNKLIPGTYNQLRLQILGLDYQPIKLLDPNMTIILVIRDRKELSEVFEGLAGGK